jgi:heme exporter protein D
MSEFLNMGGYALYVWSSYGLALVLMVALWLGSGSCYHRVKKKIIQRVKRREILNDT